MRDNRLVAGLATAFGATAALLAVGGVLLEPALLILAVVFGGVAGLFYYHASGRLLDRVYRSVERRAAADGRSGGRGGFGAGPREEWTPPREQQRRRTRRQRARRTGERRRTTDGQPVGEAGPTPREASQVLGVDPGADDSTVRRAYRERIKEVHPDAEGGDEAEFKRVQAAYEALQK